MSEADRRLPPRSRPAAPLTPVKLPSSWPYLVILGLMVASVLIGYPWGLVPLATEMGLFVYCGMQLRRTGRELDAWHQEIARRYRRLSS